MRPRATRRFWACFNSLPIEVRRKAREAFALWRQHPEHPSIKFKRIHSGSNLYSARIGLGWRALAVRDGDQIIWFWIGSHADYDKLISRP